MAKGYIVPHTHWDREWRYPIWESTKKLVEMMDELIDILEKQPGYKSFMLDGQIIPLLDYLSYRPEKENRVKELIKEGRLLIGPWYTLPDLFPVSGESIVRNLLKGRQVAERLGRRLNVGYESFGWGQPSQFPQIYNGFDIDTVIVAKNVDHSRAPDCEFVWVGKDGSEVLATRLGNEARANFFMHTYMEAMNGKPYKDDGFMFQYDGGDLAIHRADLEGCEQDYFKLTYSQKIHEQNLRKLTLDSWHAVDDTLLKEHRIMMDGSDATTAQPQLLQLIEKINNVMKEDDIEFQMSSIEEYVELLKANLDQKDLVKVHGELRDGPPHALTGNALMTRPYIKQLNRKVQNAVFDIAEPLSAACGLLGGEYDKKFMNQAIEYMLLAHSHDCINGVTQDKTAEDVIYRMNQALELATVTTGECLKTILKNIDMSDFDDDGIMVMVANPLPFKRREIINCAIDLPREKDIWDFILQDMTGADANVQRIARDEVVIPVTGLYSRAEPFYADRHIVAFDSGELPAGGYKIFKVVPMSGMPRKTEAWAMPRSSRGKEIAISSDTLENEFIKAEIMGDGTVTITDKQNNNVFERLNRFESTGDVGDYWIYYPPYNNSTFSSKNCAAKTSLLENTELLSTIHVQIDMEVPAFAYRPQNYVRGRSERASEKTILPISVKYCLKAGEDFLRVHAEINNTARDHRVSVWFKTGIIPDKVYADGHFCMDERNVLPLKDGDGKYYTEMTTNPMQTFVSVCGGQRGFAVMSNSIGEYDAARIEELGLTLFRAVRNRICTEFRSFSDYDSQDGGQCLRKLVYDYAILPHNGQNGPIITKARQYTVGCRPVQFSVCKKLGGRLGFNQSFYSVEGACVSAFKKAETGSGYILRLYNPADHVCCAKAEFIKPIKRAWLTDLSEVKKHEIRITEDGITLDIGQNKIVTILLQF